MNKLLIVIDNEVVEVTDHHDNVFGGYLIKCDNGCEYHMFDNHDAAGEAAKEYWEDMAKNDKEGFKYIVGTDNLIAWCLGDYGPGPAQVRSLEGWFDLWLNMPGEQWASYDGEEIEGARFNRNFEFEFDFARESIVLYRCN